MADTTKFHSIGATTAFALILAALVSLAETSKDSKPNNDRYHVTEMPDCQPTYGCTEDVRANEHLVYVRKPQTKAAISHHYVISVGTRLGPPTVTLIVANSPTAELLFDWRNLAGSAAAPLMTIIGGVATNAVAYMVSRLYRYTDISGHANMSLASATMEAIELAELSWQMRHQRVVANTTRFKVFFHATRSNNDVFNRGGFALITATFDKPDRLNVEQPSLEFRKASVDADIELVHLRTVKKNDRFGLRLALLSSQRFDASRGHFSFIRAKELIDDESTPGAFAENSWCDQLCNTTHSMGFLQWKPISYLSAARSVYVSTKTKSYGDLSYQRAPANEMIDIERSLIGAWFSSEFAAARGLKYLSVRLLNVSIGSEDDGFYAARNYSTFSVMLGYGKIVTDQFSLLAVLMGVFGFVAPLLLASVCWLWIFSGSKLMKRIRNS